MNDTQPEQPYGPGGFCDTRGHFAGRHRPDGCPGVSNHKPCTCRVFLWQGVEWPRPWLAAPDGLRAS